MNSFTHLHVHSQYSILDGAASVSALVNKAKSDKMSTLALTDHGTMYGIKEFHATCKKAGIKPILGAYIDAPNNDKKYAIFLAKNNSGYSELCKIITSRKLKEDFLLAEVIKNVSDNLFVLTPSIELFAELLEFPKVLKNVFAELIISDKWKSKSRKLYNFAKEKKLQIVASHPAYFLKIPFS